MAQADAIEASARELISKLPEEVPVEEWEARKEGNFYSSVTTPSFLLTLFHLVHLISIILSFMFLELFEEVDLDTFLKEDQATLTRRGKQSVAHVVGEL